MTKKQIDIAIKDMNLSDVGRLAGEVVKHELDISRLELARKNKEDAARKEYQEKAAVPKAAAKAKRDIIRAWCKREKEKRGLPLTWKFARAVVRLWRGQPKVKFPAKVKEDDVVAALLKRSWGEKYLRRLGLALDKEAILRDRDEYADRFESVGIRIAQLDEFDVAAPPAKQTPKEEAA